MADAATARAEREGPGADLAFGPFVLSGNDDKLLRDGEPVRLGSRAIHILAVLARRAGTVVSKRELMATVWPNGTVGEANLAVQIAALRQALGDTKGQARTIINIPGRGYRFVAEAGVAIPRRPSPPPARHGNLPLRRSRPIGRNAIAAVIDAKLDAGAFVTIVGPAGVGKTTAALHVAELRSQPADGAWFVDLTPIRDPEHVVPTIAAVLGIDLPSAESGDALAEALARALVDSQALVLLDNCEHLVEAVARIAALIVSRCPGLALLATSRQPLAVPGETVQHLAPLDVPPPVMLIGAEEALSYSAVHLLAERAQAVSSAFVLNDQNALSAALICRRLDGLPLAIEFASALVGTFGLHGLASRLDEHLRLLEVDRRGGSPRHRTLDAALDWSYQLLGDDERTVLRRLSIFAGGFTLEAVDAVIGGGGETFDVGATLTGLVQKSLVASDVAGANPRFRLLETTRAFGLSKLDERGEHAALAERHARFYCDFLSARHETLLQRDIAVDAEEIDNIRSALAYALAPGGDMDLALRLAAGALPVWFGKSHLRECHARLQDVTARLDPHQLATPEGWHIAVAVRTVEMFTRGTEPSALKSWQRAPVGLGRGRLRHGAPSGAGLLTTWMWNLRLPNYDKMMRLASSYVSIARHKDQLRDRVMISAVLGMSSHHMGAMVAARGHLANFLATETVEDRRLFLSQTGYDRRPVGLGMLGATLCQLGDRDQGHRHLEEAVQEARASRRALALCEAFMWSATGRLIARDDPASVEALLDQLDVVAQSHDHAGHHGVAIGLRGICLARQGEAVAAERLLAQAIAQLAASNYGVYAPWFAGALGHCVARQGRHHEALAILSQFVAADKNGNAWCTPEFLRHQALVFRAAGLPREDSDRALAAALALAQTQGSKAWAQAASATADGLDA